MKILVISVGYPSEKNKDRLVFLQRLVNTFADIGNTCTVVSPVRAFRKESDCSEKEIQYTENSRIVPVYFPKYFPGWIGRKHKIDPVYSITKQSFINAVIEIIKREKIEFDVVYAHFTGMAAICAAEIGRIYKVKSFAAAGESSFTSLEGYEKEETVRALNSLTGIVSVSSHNKDILLSNGILDDKHICVFPNGADEKVFYPQDKHESRKRFGFPEDDFIISFVGHFIERKGPLRLAEAAKGLNVKIAFAGKGDQTPVGDNVIYSSSVQPADMPTFLNASDLFVLPTLNEGCCNAIVEAIRCGIPVISSDRSFNYDVLDSSCSILVDPSSVKDIEQAIKKLIDNPKLLQTLSDGAQKRANELSLQHRAENIIKWINTI